MAYLERAVGELVAENYARAAVFAEHGIDFCCGGGRTVAEACAASAAEPVAVTAALAALDAAAEETGEDPRRWSSRRLVLHIEEVHHDYLRRTLPVLEQWTRKVRQVHGDQHPELHEVESVFRELSEELTRHMEEEEVETFPLFVALESRSGRDQVGVGVPEALVDALEHDHDEAGRLVRRLRALTDGYTPPPDACTTYRATFALLKEFEADLFHHVHLENNVLFPRAREAQAAR